MELDDELELELDEELEDEDELELEVSSVRTTMPLRVPLSTEAVTAMVRLRSLTIVFTSGGI